MSKQILKSSINSFLVVEGFIHILHVDDDSSILEVSKQILEVQGSFKIDNILSVQEALVQLKNKEYDLIISDYQMPKKDGLQFLKEIRDNKNNIPFILFTGKGREEVVIQALNLGANRYFNKNGNPEIVYGELAHAINQIVNQTKIEKALQLERKRLETVTENIGVGLTIISKDYHVLWANKLLKDFCGDISGKLCYSALSNLDSVCPGCGLKEVFKTGKEKVIPELVVPGFAGQLEVIEVMLTPVKDAVGKVVSVLEMGIDITEKKRVETRLKNNGFSSKAINEFYKWYVSSAKKGVANF